MLHIGIFHISHNVAHAMRTGQEKFLPAKDQKAVQVFKDFYNLDSHKWFNLLEYDLVGNVTKCKVTGRKNLHGSYKLVVGEPKEVK